MTHRTTPRITIRRHLAAAVLAIAGGALAACRGSAPQAPGPAPAAATQPADAHGAHGARATSADTTRARRGYTVADVRFVQHMLAHHAQALVMTALVPERTARTDLQRLAERIEVSQRDEIAQMRRWLERRGEAVPDLVHVAHDPAHAGMPGMLTPAQLEGLAAARGAAFERLFLEHMIRHHEGALVMVAELQRAPGAGQEPELFQIASDVDADQRAEIRRMRALLDAIPHPR